MSDCGKSDGMYYRAVENGQPWMVLKTDPTKTGTGEPEPDSNREAYGTCDECCQAESDVSICEDMLGCEITEECLVTNVTLVSASWKACSPNVVNVTFDLAVDITKIIDPILVPVYIVVRTTDGAWSAPDIAYVEVHVENTWYMGNNRNVGLPVILTSEDDLEVSIYSGIPEGHPDDADLETADAEFFASKWPGPGFDLPA